jgi:hypothetical protein
MIFIIFNIFLYSIFLGKALEIQEKVPFISKLRLYTSALNSIENIK